MWNRRDFLKTSALGASAWGFSDLPNNLPPIPQNRPEDGRHELPDLSPAKWIWFPSGRTLPNTFVLFRRKLQLKSKLVSAQGWIMGDSRYLLHVNGSRVQFGPGPADPRYPEVDPINLASFLKEGQNTLAATVLYYGQGDGTWPGGKPGFLFYLELEYASGERQIVASDIEWDCKVATSWRPGQYKRWYLRALQEEFDANLYPYGWDTNEYETDSSWMPAMELRADPNMPALGTNYPDYLGNIGLARSSKQMRARCTPLLQEQLVPVKHLSHSFYVGWQQDPQLYFDMKVLQAYELGHASAVEKLSKQSWRVKRSATDGSVLTFEFGEQMVGWPYFSVQAPKGTKIELLVHEAHDPQRADIINTHFNAWTRFICDGQKRRFECFDYESLRWLQLHIHPGEGEVIISDLGVRRRLYPWPHQPLVQLKDQALQNLAAATFNTLNNNAQETIVDGMGRERQQYSGDVGHVIHALCGIMGEYQLAARYIRTFSQGMTLDGYFLDCWPAYDRLARIAQRQMGLTPWGPLLDHGIAFCFDNWHYHQYTADTSPLQESFPRLLRFYSYLKSIIGEDGLLAVVDIGVPTVWIDNSYEKQTYKQCAFNLYAVAAFRFALAPLCELMGEESWANEISTFATTLLKSTQRRFWDKEEAVFVANLPWRTLESKYDERSLSLAVMYDLCPQNDHKRAGAILAQPPSKNYFGAFPANAGWRYWALSKLGLMAPIYQELKDRWANMPSVSLNNSLQEDWEVKADSKSQWSHAAMAPLYALTMCFLGIRPSVPGGKISEMKPQLASLQDFSIRYHHPHGSMLISSSGALGDRQLSWEIEGDWELELVLSEQEKVSLSPIKKAAKGWQRYRATKKGKINLRFT
ncbi:MAG: family 78 glycoside hydrolase catalytic domain [Bacteroidota bacterium]